MTDSYIAVDNMDYKNIFIDIAEKLFSRDLIDNDEKIKLVNIINRDENLNRKVS